MHWLAKTSKLPIQFKEAWDEELRVLISPRLYFQGAIIKLLLSMISFILTSTKLCCSIAKLCPTLCNPMDCNMPGFPVLHYLPKFAQSHVHCVEDAIQPSHPLWPPSPPAFSHSQHQGLFQWISSLHQVAKVLELQLQHQSFQWIFRLIFFGIDWFDLLAVQGILKSPHHNLKASVLWH